MSEFRSTTSPRKGRVSSHKFQHKEVLYSALDEMAIFEGDIAIGTVAEVEARSALPEVRGLAPAGIAITGDQYRWPGGEIPYRIAPDLPDPSRVTAAIRHWEERTRMRIRFLALDAGSLNAHPDRVFFVSEGGCWSYVGRQGGEQRLSLSPGCSTGNAIHEIGHAVGLWHEQSREDRDDFVKVLLENVIEGMEHNFEQKIAEGDDIGPYDFGSIMHYPTHAFSKQGKPTIMVPTGEEIGQREGLSDGDVAAVQTLYGEA